MYVIILFFCFIVKSGRTSEMDKEENSTGVLNFMNKIPQGDWLGRLIDVVDSVLSETYKNSPPPKSQNCVPKLLKIGENELKISIQPRGLCSYCCRLHKASRYIRFYFSSKDQPEPVEIKMQNRENTLRNVGVKPNLPTVIFIHGFGEHGLGTSPRFIQNAYLSLKEDHNIFLLDWGDLSAFPWYPQASKHTKIVGKYLGKFVTFYNDTGELPISKTHFVGFSLGAHIAGFAGKYLIKNGYEKIPRITALDPASPAFLYAERVSKEDAQFVDVIHTDAGKFGIGISIGHADFYPNGGSFVQPGCEISSLADQRHFETLGYCGHLRAWYLYAESVQNPKAFPSIKVSTMRNKRDGQFQFVAEAFMGFSTNPRTRGDFYLLTNGKVPFSKSAKEQESDMALKDP